MTRIDLCRLSRLALVAGLLLAPTPSPADYCPSPPFNAWPNGTIPQRRCTLSGMTCVTDADCLAYIETCGSVATFDSKYAGSACNWFTQLAGALHLDGGDWDEGYGGIPVNGGWTASCGVDDFLTRLLNAGYLLHDVTEHAVPFGLHRQLLDPEGKLHSADLFESSHDFRGDWWNFIQAHNQEEWVPGCNNSDKLATNWNPAPNSDHFIELHTLGAYRTTALERAAVIVHETVHEDVGHVGKDECPGGGESCDLRFGLYNARTMEIDFLYDAATRYNLAYFQGQLVRSAVYTTTSNGRLCSYDPTYSNYERNRALDVANNLVDQSFKLGMTYKRSLQPRWEGPEDADAALDATWNCDQCDASEWTFDSSQCAQRACNELLNPANEGINEHNAGQCFLYNLQVAAGLGSQEAIALAKANYPFGHCALPEESATRAFCDAEKASATHVSEIDSCGWMEGVHFPTVSRPLCIQEFCHERFQADFQANGAANWSAATGDPYGCLDAICAPDGESCNDDLSEAECRQVVVATHADPDYYAASCDASKCQRVFAVCLSAKILEDPGSWQYPPTQESVPECFGKKAMCEFLTRMSLDIFMSVNEFDALAFPGLDPVIQHPESPTLNPAFLLPAWIQDYRMQMMSGTTPAGREQIARRLTSYPEMVAGLFNLAPERFVALFGAEGFDELIGPVIHQFEPRAIRPEDLTPEGQVALASLEQLLGTLSPEDRDSAFGSIRSQALQLDTDSDGLSDASDNCPVWPNPDQTDSDANGSGNACECGDQNGDGTVNVTDIVAINRAIFGGVPASALCDANGDGLCNVSDMVAVNRKIFGGPAYCARNPAPMP